MGLRLEHLRNLKEAILVFCMLYFYGLSIALQFGRDTYGMDKPAVFIPMSGLFLFAVFIETLFAWWNKRVFLFWSAVLVLAYGFIGFFIAPTVLGEWVRPYVSFVPLAFVFFGGIAYVFGSKITALIIPIRAMSSAELEKAMDILPGWKASVSNLEKAYRFNSFAEAVNFMNQVARQSKRDLLCSRMVLSYDTVRVQLYDWKAKGVSSRVIQLARHMDSAGT